MEEGRACNHCLILDQKKACAILVRRTDKHKKRNKTDSPKPQKKKPPQTTDSLLHYFPRTPTTLHTDTKTDNTTERHSSLQQWLQQVGMVASLEDEGGKEAYRKGKRHSPCQCEIDLSVQQCLHLHLFC
jgi:hypothetical protein